MPGGLPRLFSPGLPRGLPPAARKAKTTIATVAIPSTPRSSLLKRSILSSIVPHLIPRLHPVLPATDYLQRLHHLYPVPPLELFRRIDRPQVDRDRRRLRGHIGRRPVAP